MSQIHRMLVPLALGLIVAAGPADAITIVGAEARVNTCIGHCELFPFLFPPDIGSDVSEVSDTTATATVNPPDDNGAGDTASGSATSTYGGALGAVASATSLAPLDATPGSIFGNPPVSAALGSATWFGLYEVGGVGAVNLDISIAVDGDLSFGAGTAGGLARMELAVSIVTLADFEAAILEFNTNFPLFQPTALLDAILAGNVFGGSAQLLSDGAVTPGGDIVAGNITGGLCIVASGCTFAVDVSTGVLQDQFSASAGTEVVVLSSLAAVAGPRSDRPGLGGFQLRQHDDGRRLDGR